jgi:hypothetical protein
MRVRKLPVSFLVRPINGTSGSAIAIREGLGQETVLAVFPDAALQDHALVGSDHCILVSRKRGIALVDLASSAVVKRGRLSLAPDRISVAEDGSRAIAWHCQPGLILVVDPATLAETARYNLIQACDGGPFKLLHRDHDALQRDHTPWNSIPFSDGPLANEASEDDSWAKYGSDAPTGLRRMRFTRTTRARFRADGKVVMPFEFGTNGPQWVASRHGTKPILSRARDFRVGVAVIDLETAQLETQVIRRRIEPGTDSSFAVRSISPDGSRAILQSFDPLAADAKTGQGGMLRKLFPPKPEKDLAFGLEIWNVEARPQLLDSVALRPLHSETLLPTDTQRFGDVEIAEARAEIDLLYPGIEAAFAGRADAWRTSSEKRKEDAHFDPLETRTAPAFNPPFNRVHYPALFAETMRRFAKLNPAPFSECPWEKLGDRQRRFLAGAVSGWGKHSALAASSMAWSARDRLVVLSRDGSVREISLTAGIGPAYRLVDQAGSAWPFSTRDVFPPELIHLHGNTFAVDLYNFRLEFDLPAGEKFGPANLSASTPLAYRVVRDGEAHQAEIKKVDRLTEEIRRGYVKVSSKDPARIIVGLHELAAEVRGHLAEIVVDHRWLPSLQYRGKAITESEFCDILVADGSVAAVTALDGLLSAFLDATENDPGNVWHPNDGTPTMGPVAFALIRMCDPLPQSVPRFVARRDANHDMWTPVELPKLGLPPERWLSPDLVTLQIRLAIQDLCTGNVEGDIFALYRLALAREVLRADPARASEFARTIIEQLEAQAPELSWASGDGVSGVLEGIAEALDAQDRAEAALGAELRRRAEADRER